MLTHLLNQRNASLSAASSLEYLHLAYLSKPVSERVIYRKIGKVRPTRLVVLGLGNGELARAG